MTNLALIIWKTVRLRTIYVHSEKHAVVTPAFSVIACDDAGHQAGLAVFGKSTPALGLGSASFWKSFKAGRRRGGGTCGICKYF